MLGPVSVHAAPEEDPFRGRSVRGTPTKLQGSLGRGGGSRQLLRVRGRLPLAAAPGEGAFCPNCPSQAPGPPLIVNKAPNKTLPKTKSNHVLLLLETTQGLSTPPRGQDDGPERPRSPAQLAPSDPAPPRLCLQPPAPAVLSAWTASPNSQAPGPRLLQLRPECRPSVRPSVRGASSDRASPRPAPSRLWVPASRPPRPAKVASDSPVNLSALPSLALHRGQCPARSRRPTDAALVKKRVAKE